MTRKSDASLQAWLRLPLLASMIVLVAVAATTGGARANHTHLRPALDIADTKSGVTQVWNTVKDQRGRAVRGQGTLVGIVDTGIDYRNPDFKNANGTTRIKYIWDQTSRGKVPTGFTYGNECAG